MNAPNAELIFNLERELQRSLRPVQPDPVFVSQLHTRLINPAPTVLAPHTAGLGLMFAVVGLVVGLVVLWVIRLIQK
jgi:hypothetical protein